MEESNKIDMTNEALGKISLSSNSKNFKDTRITLSTNSLVGPRIIASGVVNLQESTSKITFTAPSGYVSEYTVFLQDNNHSASVDLGLSPDEQGNNWSFSIKSKSKNAVSWMVVKLG